MCGSQWGSWHDSRCCMRDQALPREVMPVSAPLSPHVAIPVPWATLGLSLWLWQGWKDLKCSSAAIVWKLQMAGLAAHLCFWENVPLLNFCWGCHWVCCVKGSAKSSTDEPRAEEDGGISVAPSLPKFLAAIDSEMVCINISGLALLKSPEIELEAVCDRRASWYAENKPASGEGRDTKLFVTHRSADVLDLLSP